MDIGLIWVFAVSSLAVYAVVLGGWSSNSKYSFLGSLRSSAQFISYEIPLGLSVLGVMLVTGSLNLERMIGYQYDHGWNVLFQPLAALLFVTSAFAECNRLPFDLPEAEQELVGGYHTEYSAMKFAMFFLGEYTHVVVIARLGAPADDPARLALNLVQAGAWPELTVQATPCYEFPAPAQRSGTRKTTFLFTPKIIAPELALQFVQAAGVQFHQGIEQIILVEKPPEKIAPVVRPRGGQLALILAAGLFNGLVLPTEKGRSDGVAASFPGGQRADPSAWQCAAPSNRSRSRPKAVQKTTWTRRTPARSSARCTAPSL